METEERTVDSGEEGGNSGFKDVDKSADNIKSKEDHPESEDEGCSTIQEVKPAFALFWAMRKLRSLPAGANKKTIAGVLSTRFNQEQDSHFDRKVDVALEQGVRFGMLEQDGDRYCLNTKYNREMLRRDREERTLRFTTASQAQHLHSTPTRSRSPTGSQSSQSSSDVKEGVDVVAWALNKLNDKRGSTKRSIQRVVGKRFKPKGNFDETVAEALEDAVAARKVKKDGDRYHLIK